MNFSQGITKLFAFLFLVINLLVVTARVLGAALPSEGEIAFASNRDGNFEIYVMDVEKGIPINLTHSPTDDWWPA